MDFLTPEIFNYLVIANLIVGLILIAFRFYHDMTRELPEPRQHRQQVHDESSQFALEDTKPRPALSDEQLNAADVTRTQDRQNE